MSTNKLKFDPDKTGVLLEFKNAIQGFHSQPVMGKVVTFLKWFGYHLDLGCWLEEKTFSEACSSALDWFASPISKLIVYALITST